MTDAKSKTAFWTLTIGSAKEAVHLYFDPLDRIGGWLLRNWAQLHQHRKQPRHAPLVEEGLAELEQIQADLEQRRTELEQTLAALKQTRAEVEQKRAQVVLRVEERLAEMERMGRVAALEQFRAEWDATLADTERGLAVLEWARVELEPILVKSEQTRAELERVRANLERARAQNIELEHLDLDLAHAREAAHAMKESRAGLEPLLELARVALENARTLAVEMG